MSTSPAPNEPPPSTSPGASPPTPPRISGFSVTLIVVCGIVLPVVTTLVEALAHMCAECLFDPLPTIGHVFAVATVPLASVFSLWALRRRDGAGAVAHIDAVIFAQAFA